jgi:Winged helix DNA-binding domain
MKRTEARNREVSLVAKTLEADCAGGALPCKITDHIETGRDDKLPRIRLTMTDSEIIRQRLDRQHLASGWLNQPAEIVQWLGAVQAQDYAGAKWALGVRLTGTSDDDVERAFNEGAILRTHLLRPTWHFVAPADIGWLLALTAPRVHAVNASMYRRCELDRQTIQRSRKALTKALQGGRQLTRDELRAVLAQAGIATQGEFRMAYLMAHAELDGLVCSGARRGKQFTYGLLEERAPRAKRMKRDEALCELVRRYFASRGPATLQDFVWWSGLTMADAKRGVEATQSHLEHASLNGRRYWLAPAPPFARGTLQTAYLLPNYDEYGIGYRDRSAMFDAGRASQLVFPHLIVINGRLAGTWKRTLKKQEVVIETNTFTRLTRAEIRAVSAAARQYGAFLGLPVAFESTVK